jgi:hypothetical protein
VEIVAVAAAVEIVAVAAAVEIVAVAVAAADAVNTPHQQLKIPVVCNDFVLKILQTAVSLQPNSKKAVITDTKH